MVVAANRMRRKLGLKSAGGGRLEWQKRSYARVSRREIENVRKRQNDPREVRGVWNPRDRIRDSR